MAIARKIGAGALMVFASIGLLICIAAIIGAWAARGPLIATSDNVLEAVDGALALASQATQSIDDSLTDLNQRVTALRDNVRQPGSDGGVADGRVRDAVEQEIGPRLERARSGGAKLRQAVAGVNKALETANRIPGVSVPTLSDELGTVDAKLDDAEARLQDVRTAIADRDNSRLGARLDNLSEQLGTLHTTLANAQARIEGARTNLAGIQATIPTLVTTVCVVVALLSLLFGAGQVLLIRQGWRWLKQPAAPAPAPSSAT